MYSKLKRTIFFFLILLLLITLVSAIKINGRVIINFEPNKVYEGTVCVIPERVPYVEISVDGDLEEYIEIEERVYDFSNGPGCIQYLLKMPDKFEIPGIQKSSIWAKQAPKGQASTIGAVVKVGHQIWVDVPYPGKYLETTLAASHADAGENVNFRGSLTNKGEQTISVASGNINIYNWNDKLVGTFPLEPVLNLKSQESNSYSANWPSGENTVGDYNAVLEVVYDGKEVTESTNFKLGSLEVRLHDHTKEVYKKGIVPFDVDIESYWSEVVPSVNAKVEVQMNGAVLTDFETLSYDIEPWKIVRSRGFLDTTGLELGTYDLNIMILFNELNNTYTSTFNVVEEPIIEVEKPSVISGTTKILLASTLLFALIAIFLVIKIVFPGKKEENNEKKEDSAPVNPDSDQKEPPF